MFLTRFVACGAMVSACASLPAPCAGASVCGRGEECLANRCVQAGVLPAPDTSERRVLEPASIVVLAPGRSASDLPAAVTFGSRAEGPSLLLLRFVPRWPAHSRIASAFLLLDPWPGTQPNLEDVPVEVWRIEAPWQAHQVTWLDRPRLGYPRSGGLARTAPPSVLRVDVTRLVRELTAPGRHDHGMAVASRADSPGGASFATGASGGYAPRLEVYLDPAPRPGKP